MKLLAITISFRNIFETTTWHCIICGQNADVHYPVLSYFVIRSHAHPYTPTEAYLFPSFIPFNPNLSLRLKYSLTGCLNPELPLIRTLSDYLFKSPIRFYRIDVCRCLSLFGKIDIFFILTLSQLRIHQFDKIFLR